MTSSVALRDLRLHTVVLFGSVTVWLSYLRRHCEAFYAEVPKDPLWRDNPHVRWRLLRSARNDHQTVTLPVFYSANHDPLRSVNVSLLPMIIFKFFETASNEKMNSLVQ